jgi:hypothetical protein
MDKIDIVIPLGSGSKHRNAELRFALRSIERFALGVRRVVVLGVDPGFLSDDVWHVPCDDVEGNKEYRIAAKFLWAFENVPGLSPVVAMWNDDYVLTREVDVRELKLEHRGSLADAAARHHNQRYSAALALTASELRRENLDIYHYDIHRPVLYDGKFFISLLPWWIKSGRSGCGMVVKSVYGNNWLAGRDPGEQVRDCKLTGFRSAARVRRRIRHRWVFSYSDRALERGLYEWLRGEFPRKSVFEKTGFKRY